MYIITLEEALKKIEDSCFTLITDVSDIKDSLELDSDTLICTYNKDGYKIEIGVQGYVKVWFENVMYRKPSEFPDELKKIIRAGDYWLNEQVVISENNWFEIFYRNKDKTINDSTVIEVEGYSKEELLNECKAMLDWMIEEEKIAPNTAL